MPAHSVLKIFNFKILLVISLLNTQVSNSTLIIILSNTAYQNDNVYNVPCIFYLLGKNNRTGEGTDQDMLAPDFLSKVGLNLALGLVTSC